MAIRVQGRRAIRTVVMIRFRSMESRIWGAALVVWLEPNRKESKAS
ncbi:MAG: hypothetical protein ACD_75C00633G0001 [uncultured bacterium]|nr:MAG: hypothetical protein ACD_75C00633G0001 [uncultured bacterium]